MPRGKPSPLTRLRRLKDQLHYYQAQARIEVRWLKKTRAKCKEIGAQMREVAKQIKPRPRKRTP